MKKLLLVTACLGFFVSCQTNTSSQNTAGKMPEAVNANKANTANTEATKSAETAPAYSPTPSKILSSEINSRIGNVEHWGDGLCFIIQNAELRPGDEIQVIMLESQSSQEAFQAEVVEKKACKGDKETVLQTENATEYLLKTSHKIASMGVGVGIVNPPGKARAVKGVAGIDINGDGKDEYFRMCAGFESLWITGWEGKPLTGKRIWYSQYYLRYDVDPTCKKKDYEGLPEV